MNDKHDHNKGAGNNTLNEFYDRIEEAVLKYRNQL